MDKALLLGAVGVGFLLYQNPDMFGSKQEDPQPTQPESDGIFDTEMECPEGYLLDGDQCLPTDGACGEGYILSEDKTECLPINGNPCDDGYELSADGLECVPKGGICGEGMVLSTDGTQCLSTENPCGDKCFRYDEATQSCQLTDPNCGSLTGNAIGDQFLYLGESVVAGEIFDFFGRKVGDMAERVAAKEAEKQAAQKLAKEAADKLAKEVADGVAKEAADKAAREIAQREAAAAARKLITDRAGREAGEVLIKRAEKIVAKQTAKTIAVQAAKRLAVKIAVMTAKIDAMASTGIGIVLAGLSAAAMGISIGLTASGTVFEKDEGTWAWTDLPDAARAVLEAIPLFGDVLSILGEFLQFRAGCAPGLENQNGLCYEPAKPGFSCEAFLCYAQTSAYGSDFKPLSETFAHMTKDTILDTGTMRETAPPGMVKDGALAYEKPDWATTVLAGVAWEGCREGYTDTGIRCEDVYGGGVGQLKECPPGWTNDGLTCREPISSSLDPCPEGSHDVAGTCWGPVGRICGDNCAAGWDDCRRRGAFGECWGGCRETCDDIQGVTKGLAERNLRVWGGAVKGRGAGSDLPCPPGTSEGYDGLCYEACREGYTREGLLCTRSYTKRSEVLPPHELICEDSKEDIASLCYRKDIPKGYRRILVGTLDQMCPEDKEEWKGYENFNGTLDIGVSCQRATYTRPPFPAFSIGTKHKVDPPPEEPDPPLPPLCSTLEKAKTDADKVLCRVSDTPEGFDISADGKNFIRKCKEGFSFNFANKTCDRVLDDGTVEAYDNKDGVLDVEYYYNID